MCAYKGLHNLCPSPSFNLSDFVSLKFTLFWHSNLFCPDLSTYWRAPCLRAFPHATILIEVPPDINMTHSITSQVLFSLRLFDHLALALRNCPSLLHSSLNYLIIFWYTIYLTYLLLLSSYVFFIIVFLTLGIVFDMWWSFKKIFGEWVNEMKDER